GMTAGVSKTVPKECAALSERACRQLMNSGRTLDSELRSIATCASACVYALIGGVVRQVPPGSRLVVHSSRLVQLRPDGSTVTLRAGASTRNKDLHAALNGLLRAYIREMGIDERLMIPILKTPNERAYRLSRDEIVSFGIDPREFQETRWMVVEI